MKIINFHNKLHIDNYLKLKFMYTMKEETGNKFYSFQKYYVY